MPSPPAILVVEDDVLLRTTFQRLLTRAGYTVCLWQVGTEVEACIRDVQPNLLLLDLHLQRVSGWDYLEQVWANAANDSLPVLVCSGNIANLSQEQVLRLRQRGGDLIEKPFDVADLLAKVQSMLHVS